MLENSGAPIASVDQLADLARRWRTKDRQRLLDGRRSAPTPLATSPAAEPDRVREASFAIARPRKPRRRRVTEPLAQQPPSPSDINLLLLAAIQTEDAATTTTFEREHGPSEPDQPRSPRSRRWKWAAIVAGLIGCLALGWQILDHIRPTITTVSDGRDSEAAAVTSVPIPLDRNHNSGDKGENDATDHGHGHDNDSSDSAVTHADETRTSRRTPPSPQSRARGIPQGYIPLKVTTAKSGQQANHTSATQDDHDINK